MDKKSGWLGVLLVAVSTLFSLAAVEVGLRLFVNEPQKAYSCPAGQHPAYDRSGQCPTSQDRISMMRFSPDLMYEPTPDAAGAGWHNDSRGFRFTSGNGEADNRPVFKIAVTGGSTAWGVGVADDQTLESILHDELSRLCPKVNFQVWNVAVSAQTSGQERRRFETSVLPLDPDMHIAVSAFNDIYNAYAGLFPHQNRDYFEYGDRLGVKGPDSAVPQPPTVADYPLRLLHLIALGWYRLTVTDEVVHRAVDRRALASEAAVQSTMRNIDLLSRWAESYDYQFIYALQPSIYLTGKPLTADEQVIADADEQFGTYHREGYRLLKLALAQSALPNIDLDQAIKDEASTLFIDNVHFGDRGYRLMGSYLANYVRTVAASLVETCR